MKFEEKYGQWALITGGSTGIGYEIAKQAASQGLNIILVARRTNLLERAQLEIQNQYNVKVKIFGIDLTSGDTVDQLFKETSDLDVGLLVPNAGCELTGLFINSSLEENIKLLRLNTEVPMVLVHHYGRIMASKNKGGIIFVSSVFGYQGVPYVANYSATKAYILSLGEALYVELKNYGVDVSVLSPGLTKTAMTDNMAIDFNKLPIPSMSPEAVARIGIQSLGRKTTVVTGLVNKFFVWQNRLVPRSVPVNLFGFLFRRAIKNDRRDELLTIRA